MSDTDVVVLGAGPYGLSIAAHLNDTGIERRVFGRTMDAWRSHMPAGMFLKSEPYASDLSAPSPGYLLGDYCRQAQEEYHNRVVPVAIERFIAYGSWFAQKLVPDIEDTEVVSLSRAPGGFLLRTAAEETITAARVVVATGIIPFAYVPPELAHLPSDLQSHSSAPSDLSRFRGQKVLVVGGGQSALETAALLHEHGAAVKLVTRHPWVFWLSPNLLVPTRRDRLRRPVVRLCENWECWAYDRLPDAFRLQPEGRRVRKALTVLGPAGAWWLRDRVEGQLPIMMDYSIVGAEAAGDRVRLHLKGPDGLATEEADHVISGTGYKYDLSRLGYLDPAIRATLKVAGGCPILNHGLESNVPGLFFAGALATPSFGPAMRFAAGTHFAAPRIARRLRSSSRGAATRITRRPPADLDREFDAMRTPS
jgi:FAD-dependent urate hydroxylase